MAKHMIPARPRRDEDAPSSRIELKWDREVGHAQIATTRWVGDGKPDPDAMYLPGTSVGEGRHAWDGQFFDLDRQAINHLIRYLRQVRDQTFGRDE